ncbi:MAG TPA: Rrf2 family transcriptional regulator [Spirochaetota bacterium]|nr:Rrf2 family transcriptional regulator [Spirochaetota bacterium]
MKLSTRSRYGVRLMYELAEKYDKGPVQLNDISKDQDISEKYLGQIVIQLKSAGLINSLRGAQGGYFLSKNPSKITVREIVETLEGGINVVNCLEDNTKCKREDICITQKVWQTLNEGIKSILEKFTLSDLLEMNKNRKNLADFSI